MILYSRLTSTAKSIVQLCFIIMLLSGCGGGGSSNAPSEPPPALGTDAALSSLSITPVTLTPAFDPDTHTYTASVDNEVASVNVAAISRDMAATIMLDGTALSAGVAGRDVAVVLGANRIELAVTAEDGVTSRQYTIEVTRSPPPAADQTTLQLLVLDAEGSTVDGALVTADDRDETAITDEEGRASVMAPAVAGALLRLSKSGFVDQMVRLDLSKGAGASTPLQVGMVRRAAAQRFAADQPVTLSGADGLRVELPRDAFVDAEGNSISGDIDAYLTPLNISTDAGLAAFPGGYAARGPSDVSGSLITLGVADFTFEQAGQRLQLAPGVIATIDIPIYVTQNLDGELWQANDIIPLWLLGDVDAVWQYEGDGLVVAAPQSPTGFSLRGEARHFSWWNADLFVSTTGSGVSGGVFESFLEPKLHCDEIGTGCDTVMPGQQGAWLRATILGLDGPRRSMSRWVPFAADVPVEPISIPTGVSIDISASVGDGYYVVASVTPDPVRSDIRGETIVADVLLQPRHLVDGGLFVPGERLRGYMAEQDEVHSYRFEGRAGRVFRLIGYAAAGATSGPGISSDLGATVRVFRGSDLVADAIFDATTAAEIELLLPADGEYRVTFTADGKVPGFYVATTAMPFPRAEAAGKIAFPARSASSGIGLYVMGADNLSFTRLSPEGDATTCLGRPSLNTGCPATDVLTMRGDIWAQGWVPGHFQQLNTGEIAYISDHDRPGFAELFVLNPSVPELATRLSGAEVAGVDGFQVIDFRTTLGQPDRIVYKVVSANVADSNHILGRLYVVERSDPEQTRRAIPLFENRDTPRHELSADGRWVVYLSRSPDTATITGDLYAVDLNTPGAFPVNVNTPLDYAGGEQMYSFAISPDSRHVAYSVRENIDGGGTRRQAYLVDLQTPGTPIRISLSNHIRTMEIRFTPDGQQLVYRNAGTSSLLQGGTLYAVDLSDHLSDPSANPGAPVALSAQSGLGITNWQVSPYGDQVIQILSRSVWGLSLETGQAVELLRLPSTLSFSNPSPVFTSADDGILLLTKSTAPGNHPSGLIYQRFGDPVGGYRTLFDGDADFDENTSNGVVQVALSPNGAEAIVLIGTSVAIGEQQILSVPLSGAMLPTELVPFRDDGQNLRLRLLEADRRLQFLPLR